MKSRVLLCVCAAALLFAGCCKCRSYQKRTRRPLAGTEWKLVQMMGQKIEREESDAFTLLFSEAGEVSGKGACNRLMGGYTTDASRALKIGPLASTRMMCYDDRESDYFRMLEGVTHYDMDGPMLLLLSDGSLFAVFEASGSEAE